MKKSLCEKILEQLDPKLSGRLRELTKLIDRTDDQDKLILAREDIYSLLNEYPEKPRLKSLLKKVNSKIRSSS